MKILVVSQHFYPEQFRINDIAFSLVEMGHHVTVMTGLPNYPSGFIEKSYKSKERKLETINNVEVIRVHIVERGQNSMLKLALNYLSFALMGSIKAMQLKNNFDVIYVFQVSPVTMILPAYVYSLKKKTPILVHCLDQWPISISTGSIKRSSIIYRILLPISRFLYQRADVIFMSSPSFRDYFKDELKIDDSNMNLIYWPSYAEDTYLKTVKTENGFFDCVYAGNIGPALSVETLVESAHILRMQTNIRFHIVGDGLNRKNCENLAKNYQLNNIIFYGSYKVEEMKQFYDLADVFLITMVDNEIVNHTIPAKLQSYMLAGKPIIGAISGDVRKIIQDAQCGMTCKAEDAQSLSDLILKASIDTHMHDVWGKNAYQYYQQHFTKEVALKKLNATLTGMIKGEN